MKEREPSLEELATDLLREDAKSRGTTLYKDGILDERRQRTIRRREIPMSILEREKR